MVQDLLLGVFGEIFEGEMDLSFWFAVVGLVLLVGEAFVPGGTLMVLGVGLLASGVTGVLVPGVGSLLQLSVLAGVYGATAFYLFRRYELFGERTEQTSDRYRLTGATGRVVADVGVDTGRVKLDAGGFDPYYTARTATGDVIPEGTRVRVVDPRGGNVLEVAPIEDADAATERDAPDDVEG
ncbi:MAG: NfeD family protein [Halobacteriota archaeon]